MALVEGEGVACVQQVPRFRVDLPACLQELHGEAWVVGGVVEGGDGYVLAFAQPVCFEVGEGAVAGFVAGVVGCFGLFCCGWEGEGLAVVGAGVGFWVVIISELI